MQKLFKWEFRVHLEILNTITHTLTRFILLTIDPCTLDMIFNNKQICILYKYLYPAFLCNGDTTINRMPGFVQDLSGPVHCMQ